jgi:hypothetical protein
VKTEIQTDLATLNHQDLIPKQTKPRKAKNTVKTKKTMKWKGKSVKEKNDSKRRTDATKKKNDGRKKMKVIMNTKMTRTKNELASKKNNEDGASRNVSFSFSYFVMFRFVCM